MRKLPRVLIGLAALLGASAAPAAGPGIPYTAAGLPRAAAGDWPWWRGPALDGTSRERGIPTRWGQAENVVWKVKVPGRGHSSPVVCGDRVFLTTADEDAQEQRVLALDRRTGRALWDTRVHSGGFPPKNPKNSHASATPTCDGARLYCAFVRRGGLYVTATDLRGKVLWQTKAGPFTSEHGYGSSPVLYRSLVIVNGDSLKGSFVAALDRRTGKLAWRTPRRTTGRHGSYATPAVAVLGGRRQLVLTGTGEVTGYDPDTGKRLWSCPGPAEVTACTPACGETMVFATGGYPEQELLGVRVDGARARVAWRSTVGVSYVPSPVYHGGRLYVVNDGGVVTCRAASTGKLVWRGRLPGAFTASPVLVGDLLFATSESGRTFVLKAGPKFQVVATSDLGEGVLASPAVCGGQVFLRTEGHLTCVGRRGGKKE